MRAWAGFVDGKIEMIEIDDGWGGFGDHKRMSPAVFKTRADARKCYCDVRRVEITELDTNGERHG